MESSTTAFSPLIDLPIILTYIMISLGALTIIYFAIKKMIQASNDSKKTFYMIGGLALTGIVSYIMASGSVLPSYEKYEITSFTSKLIGTGLYSYSFLGGCAILLILFYAFVNDWKKTIGFVMLLIVLIAFVFNFIDLAINITYLLIGASLIIILLFGIKSSLINSKKNTKSMYTLASLILALVIAYFLASPEILDSYKKYEITAATSKQVGMGLITFYILLIGTCIAMIYSELSNKTSS